MDERTMYELLKIYYAREALLKIQETMIGDICDCGYGEGILGDLSYVYSIIRRHSPIFDPYHDLETTLFGQLLIDKTMDNHKKARLLLGLKDKDMYFTMG